jgi:hypothetical protein
MSAPPGYNPEASMLSGGNGVIHAMHGGGALSFSGYDASQGVLSGGDGEELSGQEPPPQPQLPLETAGSSEENNAKSTKGATEGSASISDLSGLIAEGPPVLEDRFQAAVDAVTKDILVFQVPLGAELYGIRIPSVLLQDTGNSVIANWHEGKYTQGEADFLHALNLRPSMMPEIFPDVTKPWEHHVADFLKSVSVSQCFKEETLLTSRECQTARHFVNAVYNYFMLNDDRIRSLYAEEDAAADEVLMGYVADVHTAATAKVVASTADPTKDPELIDMPSGMFENLENLGTFRRVLVGDKFIMPVLVVKQSSGDYYFKGMTLLEDNNITDADLLQKFRDKIAAFKEKYSSWNFII